MSEAAERELLAAAFLDRGLSLAVRRDAARSWLELAAGQESGARQAGVWLFAFAAEPGDNRPLKDWEEDALTRAFAKQGA